MSRKSLSMLSTLAAGALIGAVAGTLLAPQAGKESRRALRLRAQDSLARLRSAASEAGSGLRQQGLQIVRGRRAAVGSQDTSAIE